MTTAAIIFYLPLNTQIVGIAVFIILKSMVMVEMAELIR